MNVSPEEILYIYIYIDIIYIYFIYIDKKGSSLTMQGSEKYWEGNEKNDSIYDPL